MYVIDKDNRRIVISAQPMTIPEDGTTFAMPKDAIIVNEFDKVDRIFLAGTEDIYECELVLVDVEVRDEKNPEVHTGEYTTKAFARRIGYDNWLIEFNEAEYNL